MPSAAQIAGAEMLADMLPIGATLPKVTIASRATHMGRGIAFTIHWPEWHYQVGEYRATVIVPQATGPLRDAAQRRLKQLIERHAQIEQLANSYAAERLACDYDPAADFMVDDDMPIPSWRIHAPLVLRHALDEAGVSEETRLDLVERQTGIEWRGATIIISECEQDDALRLRAKKSQQPEVANTSKWIRRATITSPKGIWSQGITRCYLKIPMPMPETVRAAVIGRSPGHIIDLPGLDAPGLCVISSVATASGTLFDITRAHTMLGPAPGEFK